MMDLQSQHPTHHTPTHNQHPNHGSNNKGGDKQKHGQGHKDTHSPTTHHKQHQPTQHHKTHKSAPRGAVTETRVTRSDRITDWPFTGYA